MDIKIRYTWRRKSDGAIDQEAITIEQLEGEGSRPYILTKKWADGWELVARDLWSGLQDRNKVDIYNNDIGEVVDQEGKTVRFLVKWGTHRREMKSGWTVDIPGFCFEVNGFPTFPIANNYLNGHDLDIISIIGSIHTTHELLK